MRPRCVAVIPARGGSKGVRRKNFRTLPPDHSETLVTRQVRLAREAGLLDEVYVSSDAANILQDANLHMAKGITRPAGLAADGVPMLPVLSHAAAHIAEDIADPPDGLMLLMPTYPRRTVADITRTFWEWARDPSRTLVGLLPAQTPPELTFWSDGGVMSPVVAGGFTASGRRQDRRPAYEVCLMACVVPFDSLLAEDCPIGPNLLSGDMRGVVLDRDRALDIDTPADWREAQEESHVV